MTKEDALKQIREWDFLNDEERAALETLIPELRESEDERIRKGIVETIKQCPDTFLNPKNRDEMLAYLEKQKEATCFAELMNKLTATEQEVMFNAWPKEEKEQKPVEWKDRPAGWNEEKEAKYQHEMSYIPKPEKPVEWSEEDEMIRNAILGFLNPDKGGTKYSSNAELVEWSNWLKSLRPQPKRDGGDDYNKGYIKGRADTLKEFNDMARWKPSEEQEEPEYYQHFDPDC